VGYGNKLWTITTMGGSATTVLSLEETRMHLANAYIHPTLRDGRYCIRIYIFLTLANFASVVIS
jgi:hypothetical protein